MSSKHHHHKDKDKNDKTAKDEKVDPLDPRRCRPEWAAVTLKVGEDPFADDFNANLPPELQPVKKPK